MFKTTLITLALTAAAAACPAFAGPAGHAWQVGNDSYHLDFAGRDLTTAAGRADALARVEGIAARLCRNVGVRSEERACQAKVVHGISGSLKPVIEQALAERAGRPAVELAASR